MEVRSIRFDCRKACRKLVEVGSVRLDYRQVCISLVDVRNLVRVSERPF